MTFVRNAEKKPISTLASIFFLHRKIAMKYNRSIPFIREYDSLFFNFTLRENMLYDLSKMWKCGIFQKKKKMNFFLTNFFSRFLLEHSANVSAVNNDGELAIDISESDEMEELLQREIDKQGINCDESRNTEERLMLEDVRSWMTSKNFGDVPHFKTGATALHVAAAKGYIKVIGLLITAGAPVNAQVNKQLIM